jgi:hypothetical protein
MRAVNIRLVVAVTVALVLVAGMTIIGGYSLRVRSYFADIELNPGAMSHGIRPSSSQ